MRTLIAYRTRYGTTASCARALGEALGPHAAVVDLWHARDLDVASYDLVLVGGSIYAGRIQRQVVSFCERNRRLLRARPVGLFLCCLYVGEEAEIQMQSAFPDWLLAHAFARAFPGGEIQIQKLSFLDRLLLRGLMHPPLDVSRMRPEALEELARSAQAQAQV